MNKLLKIIILFICIAFLSNCANKKVIVNKHISRVEIFNTNIKIISQYFYTKNRLDSVLYDNNGEMVIIYYNKNLNTLKICEPDIKYKMNKNNYIKCILYQDNMSPKKEKLRIKHTSDNLIKIVKPNYINSYTKFNYNTSSFIKTYYDYNFDTIKQTVIYNVDTSTFCYYPYYLVSTYNTDFFLYSNFSNNPVINSYSDNSLYFNKYTTKYNSDKYATEIIEKTYNLQESDTLLIDSTVFKIFYEE